MNHTPDPSSQDTTSLPDIRNAGGHVVYEGVVVDQGLLSLRKPDDLTAFCAKLIEEFAEGHDDVARTIATATRARPGTRRPSNRTAHMFLFSSNNLGCLGSLAVSLIGTLIVLALLHVL